MKRGLAVMPGILLVIMLAAGSIFAAENACPSPRAALPRLLHQTDHPQVHGPSGQIDNAAGRKGYRIDASLIGGGPASGASPTDRSPVELTTEKDLAALRIKTDSAVTPYVGAGVTTGAEAEEAPGISSFEAERETERQAYMFGAGLACDLSHSARFNLGYRYSAGSLPELSGIKPNTTEPASSDHNISFGLKLDF